MGLKLELVLIVGIVGIILGTLMIKFDDTSTKEQPFTKEVEFTNTTLIEVDTDMMKSRAFATYGVREKGVWTLDDLVYASDTIESLHANKGSYHDDMLYLDGDVVLQEKDGYKYETQHAIYNQKTEILNILTPFTGVKNKNIIKGKSLEYNTRQKKAYGTTVGTVFYTPDK
ncbi:MAG: LPS export ABC transporter periplasmic protein LptC [Sulfurovum sp.]|nr:LPS export ABC transporter periplasmic protein LptC [Sulfurovum sp.]